MNRQQRRQAAKQNAAGFRKAAHAMDANTEKQLQQLGKELHEQARN